MTREEREGLAQAIENQRDRGADQLLLCDRDWAEVIAALREEKSSLDEIDELRGSIARDMEELVALIGGAAIDDRERFRREAFLAALPACESPSHARHMAEMCVDEMLGPVEEG